MRKKMSSTIFEVGFSFLYLPEFTIVRNNIQPKFSVGPGTLTIINPALVWTKQKIKEIYVKFPSFLTMLNNTNY